MYRISQFRTVTSSSSYLSPPLRPCAASIYQLRVMQRTKKPKLSARSSTDSVAQTVVHNDTRLNLISTSWKLSTSSTIRTTTSMSGSVKPEAIAVVDDDDDDSIKLSKYVNLARCLSWPTKFQSDLFLFWLDIITLIQRKTTKSTTTSKQGTTKRKLDDGDDASSSSSSSSLSSSNGEDEKKPKKKVLSSLSRLSSHQQLINAWRITDVCACSYYFSIFCY
jgi:hypothetical protein